VRVSADIKDVAGLTASEAEGRSLLDLLAPEEARRVHAIERRGPAKPIALYSVHLRESAGGLHEACLLVGEPCTVPFQARLFALVGEPNEETSISTARERELEARLRRISAEVRAAGLIELLGDAGDLETTELGSALSTRQLEIVELLLRGARVPAIARVLYVSQSTVRNHLSAIYRKFNVHSQSELLEKLRAGPVMTEGGAPPTGESGLQSLTGSESEA
jgi:DNA-binding CsgD family transcriptional regulator